MIFPENLKYTKDHEWLSLEGDTGTIGVTDYAQGELGDVVFVELPTVGKEVKVGDIFGTIEAVKAVSDLFSPLTGVVVEVNSKLESEPELVNSEPYKGGWMVKIKLSNSSEVSTLLDSESYRALVGH
ncbi:MAG: glycine cleavage system protein GcvH [Bacteroidota bacterium]|nr:glycine cleavage system protein GcvH [Bacteroidota bacterium]